MVRAALVAFVLLGLMPATGHAWRAPTERERGEIVVQLANDPASRCYDVSISTIDESWASAWPVMPEPDCEADWNDEVLFFHRTSIWTWVATMPGGREICPEDVPVDVGQDLRWGTAPACWPASRDIFAIDLTRLKERPRQLIHGAHAALTDLRWKGWGGRRAFARGWLRYSDAYRPREVRARVRVVLSKPGLCDRKRVYQRRRVQVVHAKDREWARALTGAHRWKCP